MKNHSNNSHTASPPRKPELMPSRNLVHKIHESLPRPFHSWSGIDFKNIMPPVKPPENVHRSKIKFESFDGSGGDVDKILRRLSYKLKRKPIIRRESERSCQPLRMDEGLFIRSQVPSPVNPGPEFSLSRNILDKEITGSGIEEVLKRLVPSGNGNDVLSPSVMPTPAENRKGQGFSGLREIWNQDSSISNAFKSL